MPQIGEGRRPIIVKKKVRRARPTTPAPRPQGQSRSFTPKGSPRPAPRPVVVKKKVYTLPRTFKTEAGSNAEYSRKDQKKVNRVTRQIVRDEQKRKARIRETHFPQDPIKGMQRSQRRAIEALSDLRASDPEKYDEKAKRDKSVVKAVARALGPGGLPERQKAVDKAASAVKDGVDAVNKALPSPVKGTGKPGLDPRAKSKQSGGPGTVAKEATDIVASTPAGVYMTVKAAKEAAKGNTKPAEGLWKDFKDTSAIAAAAQGDMGEAARRASERPLTTALEVSGAKAVVGRGAGTAARSGALGRKGKEFASTERENLRLYPGSKPGEGPEVGRRYSKDLINNRIQKAADKRKAKRGEDPNVVKPDKPSAQKVKPSVGPLKHPLDDRVDRHVHGQHVMQGQVIREAETKARKRQKQEKKEARVEPQPEITKAQQARWHTEREMPVAGLDRRAVAKQAHDVLGIEKPVRFKLMTPAMQASGARAAYKNRGDHYVVWINPNHAANQGPKGASNAAHYELGRIQGEERGILPTKAAEVGHNDPKAYHRDPNTEHAKKVMRENIGNDLRVAPPQLPEQQYTGSPKPTRMDEAGQRAAMAAQQSHMINVVKDFGIRIGPKGSVSDYRTAMKAAEKRSKRTGQKFIPVNAGRLTRMYKDPIVPQADDNRPKRLGSANERAWKQARDNHSPGQWILMPEQVVDRFIAHAEGSRGFGPLQRSANQFKDVALTTSNPIRWLGGNMADLTMRALFEGLTPADVYRGGKLYKELGLYGRKGKLVKVNTMGGGFGHIARDVNTEIERTPTKAAAKAWGKYRAVVYGIESAIETLPQMATVGKEMRLSTQRQKGSLKGLLKATDEQVQHFAREMATDPAVEMRVAKHVEDVVGKWGKLSPQARKALAGAPFAQWLGASTKYVLVTLPVKHPIKTGVLAGIAEMTEEERKKLGLSQFLPLKQQAQDHQMMMLPQKVGKDKYGPVVEGTDMSRALSYGTVKEALDLNVGGFLFPQFSSALQAGIGTSWTGERLVYPEGHPQAGMELSGEDKRAVAVGFLVESFTPFASSFRRVVQEGGEPSLPQSTILNPQVRKRRDPKTNELYTPEGSLGQGLKRFTGWPVPGLPEPKRLYTKGAVNQIERSRTAIEEVKKWNKEREKPANEYGIRPKTGPKVNEYGVKIK